MTMSRPVLLVAWVLLQVSDRGDVLGLCGGVLTATKGFIETPNFPRRFPAPLHCRWVINGTRMTDSQDPSIVVYFTQLFLSSGLSFTEFDYYEPDSTFQFGGHLIHKVTEQNVTNVQWLLTHRPYLVIDFTLDRLEGNHLRALDSLLDVYGFNITYETGWGIRPSSCSVVGCSLSGHCYASHDFSEYWCSCFEGFAGSDCGLGPLCQSSAVCENGGTCRQAGASAVLCMCPEGYAGNKCELSLQDKDCGDHDGCVSQCPEDETGEPCGCSTTSPVTVERARYEGTVRLSNLSAVRSCLESVSCSLKPTLTKYITKYLKNSELSLMEDLRVIDVGFSGEIRFHFWGGKRDGSKVRDSLNRLVQKGRLGDVTLVPTHLAVTQEPTLHVQSVRVNQPRPVIRQGEEFILSCFAQGSTHMMFRWFKDGALINVTKAKRVMWTRLLPLDSAEQYTALLVVERAEPQDRGRYTCQVTDWGYQQCKSIVIEVLTPPAVKIDPISVTLEKGENVSLKCTSANELQYDNRFGYSWTKNNALLKMIPGQEFWEDLYPGGSILRVNNVQKSVTYSCHVHGGVKSVSRNARLEVLNHSVVPWCEEVGRWPRAGPGVLASVQCPTHYTGVATRLCLVVDSGLTVWQTPDFSDCVSDRIATVSDDFNKLMLGYGNTTAERSIRSLLAALKGSGAHFPGEGEPVLSLLVAITDYLNETAAWEDLLNSTTYFYDVVNALLTQRNFIINYQKVEELHNLVTRWSTLWSSQPGPSSTHLPYESLVVDMYRHDPGGSSVTVSLPGPAISYPTWCTSRVVVHATYNNSSHSGVSVVTYRGLDHFLPQRFSMTLVNGSEVQYELASTLISVTSRGHLSLALDIELQWTPQPGWQLYCAVTEAPSSSWNLSTCLAHHLYANTTRCHCAQPGIHSVAWVKLVNPAQVVEKRAPARTVLLGCVCCLVQSLVAFMLLALSWWRHRTCLAFLKLQCCCATAASMVGFLCAMNRSLPKDAYSTVSTVLQAFILIGMSSHLSKVLVVYTELVHIPSIKHLRQTVMGITTGVPLLTVMCNHIAVTTTKPHLDTWWISQGSLPFYSCLTCGTVLTVAFVLMYIQVSRRLRLIKNSDSKKDFLRRQGMLNRALAVLSATLAVFATTTTYANASGTEWQYIFSFSCALWGFVLLLCYVLHCEVPLQLHLLRTFKMNTAYHSNTDVNPLNIVTKQEADHDCEGIPPRLRDTPGGAGVKDTPPILKARAEHCDRTSRSNKSVTFHNDLVTGSTGPSVGLEVYSGSPHKYSPLEAPTEMLARVCVIASVVVDAPSGVLRSVDSCSVVNQNIDKVEEQPEPSTSDVMDRICIDLDYLLPPELKDSMPESVQQTLL